MLGKVTKFGGPSLNGFEVIQLFSRGGGGGGQKPPGLNRVKVNTDAYPVVSGIIKVEVSVPDNT